jgi:hypothetical protein
MGTALKSFGICAAVIAALMVACIKQPAGISRDSPFDVNGSNWHPPVVTAMNDTIVKLNDNLTITATAIDNGTIAAYAWAKDGTTYSDTTVVGSLTVAWPDTGRNAVRVKVIDNDGLPSAPDSCIVTVTRDVPVPDAGQDTMVSIKDMVRLRGRATDGLGYIASWAWDIGNTGTFTATSSGDTAVTAPDSENLYYRCVLRVTDDDGNTATDTVRIMVRLDVPLADAGNDTGVWINDTVLLHGSASQQFGSIVVWEWKIGSGSWTAAGGPDTTVIMADTSQAVLCSLAVTDDDGNRGVDGIRISAFNMVMSVAASLTHSLILTTDGTLWGCGSNWSGQLGDGATIDRYSPVPMMTGVKSMAAGDAFTLILKTDGTLWACGYNGNGQLCDGFTTARFTPAQVMSGVNSSITGGYHSLIIKDDSTLWACGWNGDGQLGTGDTSRRTTPVQVMSGVKSIAAGTWHSLALKNDDTLWGWGYNWSQQVIRDPTMQNRLTPALMMGEVKGMAAGSSHSLIL